jgi:cysteinyl-tRNA synthetase
MRLYDTATRGLVELPKPGERPIGMYFCGPTVYQRIHVGNARPFVVSMWLRRWLKERDHDVTLVENITDINDKIYAAAPGDSAKLAADAARWYIEDTELLGLGRPDHEPLATETIPEIVALIEELIELDLAYEAGGDVYFRVARFEDYGRLSGRHDDESAVRNPSEEEEQSALKENPRDFALWKAHKEGEDTWWESPWGNGRPGWHIECSAMAEKHLGPVFEIHGGGLDLVFPHHENEIAQSRGAGREFARIWMHNGMLRLGGEKMSKSLGNLVSLRDAVEEWGRETILMLFLGAHWRKPMDWSDETVTASKARAEGFREAFRNPSLPGGSWDELVEALENDFNTPEALAVLHEWRDHDLLRRGLELFGLESLAEAETAPAELEELARMRADARAGGDFDEADRLRQEIEAAGWEVRDVAGDSGYQLVPKR